MSKSTKPPSAFEADWEWPENLPGRWNENQFNTETVQDHQDARQQEQVPKEPEHIPGPQPEPEPEPEPTTQGRASTQRQQEPRFYAPRTCRICLETVLPTYEPPSESLPGIFQRAPSVTYSSPDLGRLLRPCLCKGSQKFVHEGCLTAWRLQDPTSKRNYWQCPTCRYKYRLERMTWGRTISSTATQITLTVFILLMSTFVLGYFADPIINLYLDPFGTIADTVDGIRYEYEEEPVTWVEHFAKGLASLGLLGFAKFLVTLSPWHWFNMRNSGVIGGAARTGATGRERMQQISWIAVMVGVLTFLWAVWKGVRAWSRRTLEKASERVMDVPIVDDHDDD